MVEQALGAWTSRYRLREPLEMLTRRLDAIAADIGLSSRSALFAPASVLDTFTQQAVDGAHEAFLAGVTGNGTELVMDGRRVAERLVTALRISKADCLPWLTCELLSWFFDSVTAQIENRPLTRRYTDEPFSDVVAVRINPRMSPRRKLREGRQQLANHLAAEREKSTAKRMPKSGGQHIDTYLDWLVQNGLHGVSVRALARELLVIERGVSPSDSYDAHRRVQYGIARAREWLAAVATRMSIPLPAQPKRRTRKSSKRRRPGCPPG
jgi:hypothetical protein